MRFNGVYNCQQVFKVCQSFFYCKVESYECRLFPSHTLKIILLLHYLKKEVCPKIHEMSKIKCLRMIHISQSR